MRQGVAVSFTLQHYPPFFGDDSLMFLKNKLLKNGGLHYARITLPMKRGRLHFSFNILDRFRDTERARLRASEPTTEQ